MRGPAGASRRFCRADSRGTPQRKQRHRRKHPGAGDAARAAGWQSWSPERPPQLLEDPTPHESTPEGACRRHREPRPAEPCHTHNQLTLNKLRALGTQRKRQRTRHGWLCPAPRGVAVSTCLGSQPAWLTDPGPPWTPPSIRTKAGPPTGCPSSRLREARPVRQTGS